MRPIKLSMTAFGPMQEQKSLILEMLSPAGSLVFTAPQGPENQLFLAQ